MTRHPKIIVLALALFIGVSAAHFTGWSAKAVEQSHALGRRLAKLISSDHATRHTAAFSPLAAPVMPPVTITVKSNADAGGTCPGATCTLRQAIATASSGDTIDFDLTTVVSPITLTTGELLINKNLTITGPGANLLTVSGNNASRVFHIAAGSFDVTLSGVTMANGRVTGSSAEGGGIFNASTGTLNITGSTLSGNSASAASGSPLNVGGGGGIYNFTTGTVNVTNSTLSGNSASASGSSDKNNSQGGGIRNGDGTVNVTNSTLSGNSASASGGGTSINSSEGGGIYTNDGTVNVTNSTLSGNSASASGGGINQGLGGGISRNAGTVNIKNTIIAKNTATTSGPDVFGTFTSQGYNLIGDGTGSTGFTSTGDQVGTSGTPINPLLGALQNNGGPTQTMRPQPTSPAINTGTNAGAPATDQRGVLRPQNVTVDIGAVEVIQESAGMIQLAVDPAGNPSGAAVELIEAILAANDNSSATTIKLLCGTYTFATPHNFEYGPNALPPITSDITIQGNGAVLDSTATVRLRFFYVSGGLSYDAATQEGLPAGTLTLHDLTLQHGKQKGGDGASGGMGAGGAIFNQGQLTLERVTLTGNTATGGNGSNVKAHDIFAGGGMGQDAQGSIGGGFGGPPLGKGGSANGNAGGGGFRPVDNASSSQGGGLGLLGGGLWFGDFVSSSPGDGGAGFDTLFGTTFGQIGGNYGYGGDNGGGVGGGGGGDGGGGGGFGGGGGGQVLTGLGGFGGGAGAGLSAIPGKGFSGGGPASFGGGADGIDSRTGGGGGGMGGAIFNHRGSVTAINVTLTANTARGGNSGENSGNGSGFGGAIFNLNGTVNLTHATLASNVVAAGTGGSDPGGADGGAFYSLAYGNKIEDGTASTAAVTLRNSILADSVGGRDLINDKRDKDTTPAIGTHTNTATVDYGGRNIVETSQALSGTTFTGALYSMDDPQLGMLTMPVCKPGVLPIAPTSPAHNNALCDMNVPTDELGTARPQGAGCDIGAYELPEPDLSITKTDNGATFTVGSTGQYFIVVSNAASASATTGTITVTDMLPANLTLNSFSGTGWTCTGTTNVSCLNSMTLAPGASLPTLTLTVNVGAGTPLGTNSITNTATVATTGETAISNNSGSDMTTVIGPPPPLNVKIQDPAVCTGPGGVVTVTANLTNPNPSSQSASFTATLPAGLLALPGTCTASVNPGGCVVTPPSMVSWSGMLAANQTVTITYQAQVADGTLQGTPLCINSTGIVDGNSMPFQACTTVNCPTVGPGTPPPAAVAVSDQKPGSVLFYNLYTSNPANLTRQNTRINITNTDPARSVAVHLFFVDGASCTPADSYVCLTPNQTLSFLASDVDPGTTGYIIAVASDSTTGCPINFNFLIGDEFVKLATGHQANLGAESFAALVGTPPACNAATATATLNFDGVSYNQVPRVLAVDNFLSPSDTLLILNRVGGDLASGASTIGALFGVLYDEAEQPFSFTLSSNTCQLRGSLDNSFLRTTPRLETVISAGRSGWLRLWGTSDIGLLGSVISLTASAGGVNNFNQGHNLHKLTFTSTSLTIPIIPPACQ